MARHRYLSALLAVGLLLASCGDDDDAAPADDASDQVDETPSPTPGETEGGGDDTRDDTDADGDDTDADGSSGGDDAADRELAESGSFQLSDFPAGWTESSAGDEDDDDEEQQRAISACLGEDYEELYPPDQVEVSSPSFTSPSDQEASSDIEVAASVAAAEFQFATLTSQAAIDCVSTEFERALAEDEDFAAQGVEVGELSIEPLDLASVGDESAAFRISAPLSFQGQEFELFIDVSFARVGRVLFSGTVFSFGEPFPVAEFEAAVTAAVGRIDADAAG